MKNANQKKCYAKIYQRHSRQYSVHLDQQIEHRQEVAVGAAVAIKGGVSNVTRMCGQPTFFFFLGRQRSGYETRKRIGVLLTTDSEAPRNLKGSEDAHISLHIFFFFFCGLWLRTPRPPPRGRGDSKRSTGHEQIEQSAIQSASRVTLAPQHEKAEGLIGEGSEEASESGRPAWSAVHVVQVHIGSNLQRGRFRPCVSGLLAKHLVNPVGQSAALSREAPGARESASPVVSMPSGAVETQWQVPAVEAISKTIMRLHCVGPMKAPRAGVRGRVVCASRFRGSGMAIEECWGAPLHQLVHNPETGERPVHIPWPEEVLFFFFSR